MKKLPFEVYTLRLTKHFDICAKKERFLTLELAELKLNSLAKRNERYVYACISCNGYHLARNKELRKKATNK